MKHTDSYEVFADAQRDQDRIDREERWLAGVMIVMGCISIGCLIFLVVS